MTTDDRIERAREIYERTVYAGTINSGSSRDGSNGSDGSSSSDGEGSSGDGEDSSGDGSSSGDGDGGDGDGSGGGDYGGGSSSSSGDALAEAERGLDAVEADVALARGRIRHARFQNAPKPAVEDPAELPLFERALTLYRAVGDTRGEAEALFWIGCVHQFIRRDDETALPYLERSERLTAEAGDQQTRSEALRHLGIVAHTAGRLDEARDRLTESSRLRREAGALPGVASNLIGLAYIAAQNRRTDALATLDEAESIAREHGAHAILRNIEQARTRI